MVIDSWTQITNWRKKVGYRCMQKNAPIRIYVIMNLMNTFVLVVRVEDTINKELRNVQINKNVKQNI